VGELAFGRDDEEFLVDPGADREPDQAVAPGDIRKNRLQHRGRSSTGRRQFAHRCGVIELRTAIGTDSGIGPPALKLAAEGGFPGGDENGKAAEIPFFSKAAFNSGVATRWTACRPIFRLKSTVFREAGDGSVAMTISIWCATRAGESSLGSPSRTTIFSSGIFFHARARICEARIFGTESRIPAWTVSGPPGSPRWTTSTISSPKEKIRSAYLFTTRPASLSTSAFPWRRKSGVFRNSSSSRT